MRKPYAFRLILFLLMICSFFITTTSAAAQLPVPLGATTPFAALAGSGITNTGSTTLAGDVGSHPTTTQTGFASVTLIGTNHGGDATTQQAKTALRNAFLDAAGRLGATPVAGGALGGQLLTPGVYKDNGAPASLGLTGILRLDAQGDPSAVFIFQSASTLSTEVGSSVVLLNGAQACNVFWQVGSAATLKTSTTFVGTILANDDISVQAGATVSGRLLAGAQANGAGALTLINNSITTPACAVVPVASADLTISKSHSGSFAQGQVGAIYTLATGNVGPGPTAGVVTVSDTLPAGLTATAISGTGWSCALVSLSCTRSDLLAAGGSYPAITVTVNVANNAPATVLNTAVVSGGGELNVGNNTATDSTTITQATPTFPDLTITKSHSGVFQAGGSGVYNLAVRNIGQASTNGSMVTVSDTLPASLTATAMNGAGWNCTLISQSCTRSDSLAAGSSYPTITVIVNVANDAPPTVLNTVTVSGGGELNTGNNTATDVAPVSPTMANFPDLTITKHHTGDFLQGGTGAYRLTVKNVGQASTSGAIVTVRDILPAGLTATAIAGAGWNCSLASLSCTRSDSVPPGASYPTVAVTVNVDANALLGGGVGDTRTFQQGDILISLANGTVQWRRPDWTLVKTIQSVTDGQAKGMAFDALGNLFLTHYYGTGFSGNGVVKFDRSGRLIGLLGGDYDCNPSSVVVDRAGNIYVGHADCSGDILKLDNSGNRLAQYNVAVENRGSGHILLDPDQCTMYYTSQGPSVKRFNVCTHTQMSDFNNTPLPDAIGGAHRLAFLPGGGMLVANFAVISRLDASGNLMRTYDAPALTHCWLGVALDPGDTSFWATNWCGSSATRFDLATGRAIESQAISDTGFMAKQIVVVGPMPPDVVAAPGLRSIVVINAASVSGGDEVNTENNSASDPTTIIAQPQVPILSMNATTYCVGAEWRLGVTNAVPNASVRLIGTTNGQPWVMNEWGTSDGNGTFNQAGTYAEGSQGTYTLAVAIVGNTSNTLSVVISDCRQ
jgi:uncharacterized repeat protein (TIGR01451 family)